MRWGGEKQPGRNGRRGNGAFTLLELLLGTAIGSVVLLCVYSAFSTGIQLNMRSQAQNRQLREARWAVELIENELANMVAYDFSGSYDDKFAFDGDGRKIAFILKDGHQLKRVSYYLAAANSDQVHEVLIGETHEGNKDMVVNYAESDGEYALMREEAPLVNFMGGAKPDAAEKEIISMGMDEDGLKFSFGSVDAQNDNALRWEGSWKDNVIPAFVRLEMHFRQNDGARQPLTINREIFIPHGARTKKG